MRTVQNTKTVEIKVSDSELIEGKWINFSLLSEKLHSIEKEQKLEYKALRNRFYNSIKHDKYNTIDKVGLQFVDIDNPMKKEASLELKFVRV